MYKNSKGMTLITIAVSVLVMILLLSTIVISANNIINTTRKKQVSREMDLVQASWDTYIARNSGEIKNLQIVELDVNSLSPAAKEQFIEEPISNGKVRLAIIDLKEINVSNLTYGNLKEGSDDRYLVSLNTGKIYYEKGFAIGDETFYILTAIKKTNTNVDKTVPIITATNIAATSSSIRVGALADDTGATLLDESSYQYSKDGGINWTAKTNQIDYTFTGLASGTYECKVKVANVTGNTSISNSIYITTAEVGIIGLSANPNSWTNANVIVNINYPTEIVTKQYSIDGTNWLTYTSGIEVSSNGSTIYAKGSDDAGNQGAQATLTVANIDKTLPLDAVIETAVVRKDITANISISDNVSGSDINLAGSKYLIGTSGVAYAANDSAWDTATSFTSKTQNSIAYNKIIGDYYIQVLSVDSAGNKKVNISPAISITVNEVASIALGQFHTVALMDDGTLRSLGYNTYGQLGDATTENKNVSTQIAGLTGVKQIVTGLTHTVALLNDGTVKAWGRNVYGQLGDGTETGSSSPIIVTGLTNVKQISAGGYNTGALLNDETVKMWGYNGYGQLGNNTTVQSNVPIDVPGLTSVKQIKVGYFAIMAILNDGTVKSWGMCNYGQLGIGTISTKKVPTVITGLTNVSSISFSNYHAFAILNDGTVKKWGYNYYGQLGDGTNTDRLAPIDAPELTNVKQIVAGINHTVVVLNDGTIKGWGHGGYGQLGEQAYKNIPADIGLTNVDKISAGYNYSLAILNDGTLKSWGYNANGELGNLATMEKEIPITISGVTNIKQLETGNNHTGVVLNDGTVKMWGRNSYGQIGLGTITTYNLSPTLITGLSNVKEISIGGYHSTALLNDGTVKSWRYNLYGGLGDGTLVDKSVPTDIVGLTNVKQISAGAYHTVALLNDGTVKNWGRNSYGELGDNTTTNSSTPINVIGLSDVIQISASTNYTLALSSDGTVKAWGINNYGQLGDGTTTARKTPITIPGLTNVKEIRAGGYTAIALLNDGTIKTWGHNEFGQMGDGTFIGKRVPTDVPGISNVKQVDAGDLNTVILLNDGTVKTFGYNIYGQLGDGATWRETPVDIAIN